MTRRQTLRARQRSRAAKPRQRNRSYDFTPDLPADSSSAWEDAWHLLTERHPGHVGRDLSGTGGVP